MGVLQQILCSWILYWSWQLRTLLKWHAFLETNLLRIVMIIRIWTDINCRVAFLILFSQACQGVSSFTCGQEFHFPHFPQISIIVYFYSNFSPFCRHFGHPRPWLYSSPRSLIFWSGAIKAQEVEVFAANCWHSNVVSSHTSCDDTVSIIMRLNISTRNFFSGSSIESSFEISS